MLLVTVLGKLGDLPPQHTKEKCNELSDNSSDKPTRLDLNPITFIYKVLYLKQKVREVKIQNVHSQIILV